MKNKNSIAAFRRVLSLFDQELTPVIKMSNGQYRIPESFKVHDGFLIIGETDMTPQNPPNMNEEQAEQRFLEKKDLVLSGAEFPALSLFPTTDELYGNEFEMDFVDDAHKSPIVEGKTKLSLDWARKLKLPVTIIKKRLGGKK